MKLTKISIHRLWEQWYSKTKTNICRLLVWVLSQESRCNFTWFTIKSTEISLYINYENKYHIKVYIEVIEKFLMMFLNNNKYFALTFSNWDYNVKHVHRSSRVIFKEPLSMSLNERILRMNLTEVWSDITAKLQSTS